MSRRITLVIAILHLVVSVALTATTYALSMDRFDADAPPTPAERIIEVCLQVLCFPIVRWAMASRVRFPGLIGYLPFIVNSLLWATAISWIYRVIWHPKPDAGLQLDNRTS